MANWFNELATRHGKFNVELVDLADVNLPVFDEPHHPRLRQYQHEHTKKWSAIVERADAVVFVMPEYNYHMAPSLVNALDYLMQEWAYKPASFVSYGGLSGGMRAVQTAKLLLTTFKVMPLDGVAFPNFAKLINAETGLFTPEAQAEKGGENMLNELLRWATALKPLREPA